MQALETGTIIALNGRGDMGIVKHLSLSTGMVGSLAPSKPYSMGMQGPANSSSQHKPYDGLICH